MISIDVFSEEKAWSKKLKKKNFSSAKFVNHFQKNINFLTKKLALHCCYLIIETSKN